MKYLNNISRVSKLRSDKSVIDDPSTSLIANKVVCDTFSEKVGIQLIEQNN